MASSSSSSSGSRRVLLLSLAIMANAIVASVDMASAQSKFKSTKATCTCLDPSARNCFEKQYDCPNACPQKCIMDCKSCKPICLCDKPGGVCQDPRFIGGDGITFYFHGHKDQDFCLVSDTNVHINAHFIGKRGSGMTRDFTWVQAIGVIFKSPAHSGTTHSLYVGATKTAQWEDSVDHLDISLDGAPLLGLPQYQGAATEVPSSSLRITRLDNTNVVRMEVDKLFQITATVVPITEHESRVHRYGITQDDCFAHLELNFKFLSLSPHVTGVLGQTYSADYRTPVKMLNTAMPVVGGEANFFTPNIFSTDCKVSRFDASEASSAGLELAESSQISCTSAALGHGIVCRR